MEDAFARFQADLSNVGAAQQQQFMPPPMFPPQPVVPVNPYAAADYSQANYGQADYSQAGYAQAGYEAAAAGYGAADYSGYYDYSGAAAAGMQQPGMAGGMPGPSGMQMPIPGQKPLQKKEKPPKKGVVREAAGKRWRDPTLDEWPDNDYRIFVGDLGNECNEDALAKAFQKYPSFAKAKIVKDKRTKKTKGFGFVSFLDSLDMAKALKEMNGKYIGNRPCKLRKSSWDERNAHFPTSHNKKQKQGEKKK